MPLTKTLLPHLWLELQIFTKLLLHFVFDLLNYLFKIIPRASTVFQKSSMFVTNPHTSNSPSLKTKVLQSCANIKILPWPFENTSSCASKQWLLLPSTLSKLFKLCKNFLRLGTSHLKNRLNQNPSSPLQP